MGRNSLGDCGMSARSRLQWLQQLGLVRQRLGDPARGILARHLHPEPHCAGGLVLLVPLKDLELLTLLELPHLGHVGLQASRQWRLLQNLPGAAALFKEHAACVAQHGGPAHGAVPDELAPHAHNAQGVVLAWALVGCDDFVDVQTPQSLALLDCHLSGQQRLLDALVVDANELQEGFLGERAVALIGREPAEETLELLTLELATLQALEECQKVGFANGTVLVLVHCGEKVLHGELLLRAMALHQLDDICRELVELQLL
mmetsp:Transcript_114694/g.370610  ORF Transcript_114694/g.370610 Transcript_114694/m.370610 type:complete len:260 (-) Transcript_114694:4746-5525(-)